MFLLKVSFIGNRAIFNWVSEDFICHVTTWFNVNLLLWMEPLRLPSLGAIGLVQDEILNFLCDHTRLRSQRFIWRQGWLPVIRHHSAWWYRPCRRRDIKFWIWYVTSCDDVIKVERLHYGLCLTIHQYPANFCGHTSSGGGNISFLVCQVTSCDQVVR